tara:strand:+ start:37 stop:228 length:192 start_codon:yes stop_codon:yes gene_type:complete
MNNNHNKIASETVDTLIDQLDQTLVDYMYEYGEYTESNDEFALDQEYLTKKVILELYNRLKNQ